MLSRLRQFYTSLEPKIPAKDAHPIPLTEFLSECDAAFDSARHMGNDSFGVHSTIFIIP
jgi:hypothetical protein